MSDTPEQREEQGEAFSPTLAEATAVARAAEAIIQRGAAEAAAFPLHSWKMSSSHLQHRQKLL